MELLYKDEELVLEIGIFVFLIFEFGVEISLNCFWIVRVFLELKL